MFDVLVRVVRFPTFVALSLTNVILANLAYLWGLLAMSARTLGLLLKAPFVLLREAYRDNEGGWERYRARIVGARPLNTFPSIQRTLARWAAGRDDLSRSEIETVSKLKFLTLVVTLPLALIGAFLFWIF